MITVIGLGTQKNDITARGLQAMKKADKVVFRTALTSSAKGLFDDKKHISLDSLYEQAEDFETLLANIVSYVLDLSTDCNLAYMVEGDGIHDRTVEELRKKTEISIIAGVGFESYAEALTDCSDSVVGIMANDFVADKAFFSPRSALVIKEIDNIYIASETKLKLMKIYGEDIEVYFINGKGCEKIPLDELDRQKKYDYNTGVFLSYQGFLQKKRFNFSDLMEIVYRLRGKDGCPWDKAQTHETIRQNAVEEAYELLEAINLGDTDKMNEEAGDVLLQGVFHAIIAEDNDEFDITDMLTVLCTKLINRHTHIFGNVKANNASEALSAWEAAKAVEKKQGTYSDRMEQVAPLPALIKAEKIQRIASKAGFDWSNPQDAAKKIYEEAEELFAPDANLDEEGGDLLFAVVNVLRKMKVEPEMALYRSISKFQNRFKKVEEEVLRQGKNMNELTLDELDAIYNLIKKQKQD